MRVASALHKRLGSFEKFLPVVSLVLLLVVAMFMVWQISNVQFDPAPDSVDLTAEREAQLRMDTNSDKCLVPIRNRVLSDATAELGGVQSEVWACIQAILKTEKRPLTVTSLPHEWRSTKRLQQGVTDGGVGVLYSADFLIEFMPEEGMGLWGLVLTGVGHNVMVFLNGKLLGKGGDLGVPYARNHSRPLMFSIPDGVFIEGNNKFQIYVVSEAPGEGFLGKVYIAPAEMLSDAHRHYHFVRFVTPQVIMLSMLLLSGLMCLLWFYRQQDVEYLLLGLMSFFWSLHTLDQFVVHPFISTHFWNWLISSSFGGLVVCSIFFIHRFLGQQPLAFERRLLLLALGLSAILWLLPEAWFYALNQYIWHPLMLMGAFYVSLRGVMQMMGKPSVELYALTLAVTILFLLACHDQMVLWGVLPVYDGKLLHFGAAILLLAFTWILLRRFVFSLHSAERYNNELRLFNQKLESRVEEKSKRIAQSYEMIRQLGQDQVVQQERSRIMRDMHDGIGVYLTSMLRQLEFDPLDREHLRDSAHNALNDLRLMIDSLGSTSTDLPAMLGMFRTRIARLIEACQVELIWEVEELPPVEDFGPERALNLLRILQEAVTNALKHAEAKSIRLSAFSETSAENQCQIVITITDDGRGFFPEKHPGNGLNNMRHRARKIRADFTIDTSTKGTCIRVTLPVSTQSNESPPNSNKNDSKVHTGDIDPGTKVTNADFYGTVIEDSEINNEV